MALVQQKIAEYLASFPRDRRRLWRWLSGLIEMKLLRYASVLKVRILVKVLSHSRRTIRQPALKFTAL